MFNKKWMNIVKPSKTNGKTIKSVATLDNNYLTLDQALSLKAIQR